MVIITVTFDELSSKVLERVFLRVFQNAIPGDGQQVRDRGLNFE